ncbi:MAG: OmpA family protein [Saprospiraceae bacterium]
MGRTLLIAVAYFFVPVTLPAQGTAPSRIPLFEQEAYPESNPVATIKEDELFFCSRNNPINFGQENHADIWSARIGNGGVFSRPINAGGPLNDSESNIPMAMNMDGSILYLWNQSPAGTHIAFSQRQGRNWQSPQKMVIAGWEDPEIRRIRHWHVSVDGQLLLIAAVAKGREDEDLYIARRRDAERWETPAPLVAPINSAAREAAVFLAADGRSLYFSSDRRGGQGGLDLYMVQRLDDSWAHWSTPVNLGPSINTAADETQVCISASGETAFFVAGDPTGNSRIYRAPLPPNTQPLHMFLLSGKVVNALNGLPTLASVCIYGLDKSDVSIDRCGIRPDRNGVFQLLVPQSHKIGVFAEKNGMFSSSHYFLPGGNLGVAEDQEEALLADLSANEPAYREREKEIMALQEQRQELETVLVNMEELRRKELVRLARMEYTESLAALDHDIDWPLFRGQYEAMREQYNKDAAIPEGAPTSGDAAPAALPIRESVYPETAQGRIQALRERQQLRRELSATAEINTAAPLRLFDFEGFGKALEGMLMQTIQDSLLPDMEKQFLGPSASSLRGVLADDQIPILDAVAEQKKRELLYPGFESALTKLGQFGNAKVGSPVRLDWQQTFADTLGALLLPSIAEKVVPVLKNSVKAYLEFDLLCGLYQAQTQMLDQKLEGLTQRQIQLEKSYRRKTDAAPLPPPVVREDTLTVIGNKAMYVEIRLFDPGQQPHLRLENIFFEPNTAVLEPMSRSELQRLATFLKQSPGTSLLVEVHTNGLCSHSFAKELTGKRAETIKSYLTAEGIDPLRISATGKGKYAPLAPNDDPEGRRTNQRVEIYFTLYDE